jgi:mono/diheme cytochrome c family protein
MKKQMVAIMATGLLAVIATAGINLAQRQTTPSGRTRTSPAATAHKATPGAAAPTVAPTLMPVEEQQALVKRYCSGCHNDTAKAGGMTLTKLDLAHPEQNPELAEKLIHQVKFGQMPKVGAPRPEVATLKLFATTLETEMDKAAALHPNPGSRPFQRLTCTEYAKSIKDMLGIDEDVSALLPADTISENFDNIADSQAMSTTLMESYMRAAAKISRDALDEEH